MTRNAKGLDGLKEFVKEKEAADARYKAFVKKLSAPMDVNKKAGTAAIVQARGIAVVQKYAMPYSATNFAQAVDGKKVNAKEEASAHARHLLNAIKDVSQYVKEKMRTKAFAHPLKIAIVAAKEDM